MKNEAKDTRKRCHWVPLDDLEYVAYHDTEWGVPVHDDRTIFEFLVLESFQAGLSWRIILRKRGAFRKAFAGFDYKKVAKFTVKDAARLMQNEGIVRNRAKIESAIQNAQHFLEIQKEFGTFSKYVWSFVGGKPLVHKNRSSADYLQFNSEAIALAKDLKARGFKFMGDKVVYAHMQATGMVNDHLTTCFRYKQV